MKKLFCIIIIFLNLSPIFSLELPLLNLNNGDIERALSGLQVKDISIGSSIKNEKDKIAPSFAFFNGDPSSVPDGFVSSFQNVSFFDTNNRVQDIDIIIFHLPNDPTLVKDIWETESSLKYSSFESGTTMNFFHSGLSTGEYFGDSLWRLDYEEISSFPAEIGNDELVQTRQFNIFYLHGDTGYIISINKNRANLNHFAEILAKISNSKLTIAVAIGNLIKSIDGLIPNKGILKSLQAKLDAYRQSHLKGEYKAARNNINAFINELNAQRGKQIPENSFNILNKFAVNIISGLNFLLQ